MPSTGHFILHSNVLPSLTAGRYELLSQQDGTPFDVADEHTHVVVAAPRYVMPTDQILSTFPPANAEGAFSDRLPQIVLKRRTLPWERNPAGSPEVSTTPWLALVVVAEGEAELSTTRPVAECVTPGKALFEPEDRDVENGLYLAVTETVVRKIFPTRDDLDLLVHVREVNIDDTELANGDDDGWLAVVLANRLPVFDTANNRPVRYMACLLNLEGQLDVLPATEPPEDFFTFELAQDWTVLAAQAREMGADARVMGGPASSISLSGAAGAPRPAAPLIQESLAGTPRPAASLNGGEAMQAAPVSSYWSSVTEQVAQAARDPDARRLVRDTMAAGFRLPIELFALEQVYRFPVLAHWSFTTNGEVTFRTLMHDLDVGLLGSQPEPVAAPAGAPAASPSPAPPAPEIVQTGHIGLDHRTRRGDPTRAWYRGPLAPFPLERDPVDSARPLLAHSADQLRRIVPDGREDLALAAAFEIGRLLALSQLSVVSALLRFRSEQFGAGRVREVLSRVTQFELPELVDQRIDLGRFMALQVVDTLRQDPGAMLGPRRPIADPGREIKVSGDLDEVIAAGLGFDLDTVRRTGEQVGILAALTQLQAPLANPQGQAPLDKAALAGMRTALYGELENVLNVAAPPQKPPVLLETGPSGAPARPPHDTAPPPRDVLDELIARVMPGDDFPADELSEDQEAY